MHMWKWNLAFQCIVNIGVRGSENVRTRVVEADMVPVIATILWDYILVIEREKAKADAEQAKHNQHSSHSRSGKLSRDMLYDPAARSSFFEHLSQENRPPRRQAPPPSLDIQQSAFNTDTSVEVNSSQVLTSPPERTVFRQPHLSRSFQRSAGLQPPATAVPSMENDGFSLRPVRDADRLPSMLPPLQTGVTSNPDSPTTPLAPRNALSPIGRRPRRPSIRHQTSTSGDDDVAMEEAPPEAPPVDDEIGEPSGTRTPTRDASPEDNPPDLRLTIPAQEEVDNVDIAQQTPTAVNVLNALTQNQEVTGTSPNPAAPTTAASPAIPLNAYPNYFLRNATSTSPSNHLMPRDEDVLMGLQLLAYISKYCYLRHYFQRTHLVPRLRIDKEVEKLYGPLPSHPSNPTNAPPLSDDDDADEEFLQQDDYNIFPLVEKFTVRCHSKDMQNWACVVMRNLCRKDDARGGIRQCANYVCGKWEEFPRQFAKCRRCRRTKYCSKVSIPRPFIPSSSEKLMFCRNVKE
jgi:hypothetical protein